MQFSGIPEEVTGHNTMKEQIEFLKRHCEFNSPTDCYIILAVSRKKDTPDITNSTEIVFRDVIKSASDIEKKYLKIRASVTNYRDVNGRSFPFYIYISSNPRDGRKATIELVRRITYWLELEPKDKAMGEKYKRTYSEFYSALAIPECRGSKKYFMIDVDTKDPSVLEDLIDKLGSKLLEKRETRHGYHIKTLPFNRLEIPDITGLMTTKTDALMFVE